MLLQNLRPSLFRTTTQRLQPWRSYSTAHKKSDPLRILFCGSDNFSCASLQALHDEHKQNPDLIRSIDVLVRPSKLTGRGNKVMKEVPAQTLAKELNLPIHTRDTFTGWDMPQPSGHPINLIIAVSFGLFVPPRLLSASKYGGLNVHPSLLPDLRGPAPLHHALLSGDSHTGVSIQTLSPQTFDAGHILLQTPRPGIFIPPSCTLPHLHSLLTPLGASMLVETLRRGLHVPPYPPTPGIYHDQPQHQQHYHHHEPPSQSQPQPHLNPATNSPSTSSVAGVGLRHAPKITPHDKQLLWTSSSAPAVARRATILGPLWTHARLNMNGEGGGKSKRVILEDISVCDGGEHMLQDGGEVEWVQKLKDKDEEAEIVKLKFCVGEGDVGKEDGVVVCMPDGTRLMIGRIKVEGSTSKPARGVLESFKLR